MINQLILENMLIYILHIFFTDFVKQKVAVNEKVKATNLRNPASELLQIGHKLEE